MSDMHPSLALRFRGFLPVVIDVETGGFNASTDALLEIAAVLIDMDAQGYLRPSTRIQFHVDPFPGANIEQAALDFTGIDPHNPLRGAVTEDTALKGVFEPVRKAIKKHGCNRAVLVGHNSFFDLGFLNAAAERNEVKRNPFHPFSSFDTAALAGLVYGQTVLAKACEAAGIRFSQREAHSALYDATRTAELFCSMVNRFRDLGGWPPPPPGEMPPTLAKALD
ncbi:MAG: ribonuclease T [Alcanivorax sediminis]|uniref:Ribonuclease T n=1 Tax=Alcanivorax sediminis TaxID=2663008 RepID=A0A6N7LZR4_9GAMM|nr:ribonuclease T [Alcanivorax sediminis]MQX54605.1 ribonuclease T [Alcanivorax sediminis]